MASVDVALKEEQQGKVREQRARLEAEWLGYTLEKSPRRKTPGGDGKCYRILLGDEVYKGGNYTLRLAEVEELVENERSAITNRLTSELSQSEKETRARLMVQDGKIFRQRLRAVKVYVKFVNEHLRIVDIFIRILRSRSGNMSQAGKVERKLKEIRYLNSQIKCLQSQELDVSELLALRDQLEFELEEVRAAEDYRRIQLVEKTPA